MSVLITLIAAVLVFSAVIAIHEFGHFFVAKLSGVQVNEFAIGMGPLLFRKIVGGTQYSLRLLPVGGYVALEGEVSPESQQAQSAGEPDEEVEEENPIPPELRTGVPLNQVAVWKQMAIMAAGAIMNFVLGFVVLVLVVATQQEVITSRVIYSIDEGALCGQTGLEAGDEIVAVNGRRCFVANDILYELARTESHQAEITVRRDGALVELPAVQFDVRETENGAYMDIGFVVYGIEKTPFNVLKEAWNSELYYGRIVFTSLIDLARGRQSINDLSGPVGIVSAIGQAASYGLGDVLELLALLTINLGIFNLLPVPALDGGKLVFLLIQGITGRPVPEKLQGALTLATFALLFGLMIFATYNDILRLFGGGF